MTSSVFTTSDMHRPNAFSEKIDHFYRTSENVYSTSSGLGRSGSVNSHHSSGGGGHHSPSNTGTSPIPHSASSLINQVLGHNVHPTRLGFVRDTFELYIELPQYKPEQIQVSTQDDLIIISGKREEHHPEHGYQSKEFRNKYTMPPNIDKSKMTCIFKERGFLKVEAPFLKHDDPTIKTIPIKMMEDTVSVSFPANTPDTPPVQTTTAAASTSKTDPPLPPTTTTTAAQPSKAQSPQPNPIIKNASSSSSIAAPATGSGSVSHV